ncbi:MULTISPECIES: antiviral reverse transcriptase Drt3b [Providencia]|uniref:antiviral reverse transcriptase Drt3b n=1 Tax=Providencia TaxID=586 RepID=UPI0018C7FDB5|nr:MULTISPECIES: antiviral reverse transcriptase Drt3b [Providencia]MBG5928933.1 RNA-directed DNA polymerase [Providencia rettgeri]
MPKIVKVNTKDKYRALLTDVLPYELPLWYSNFTMYERLRNSEHYNSYATISGIKFENSSGSYIPLDYLISRGGNKSSRSISIMHPAAQLKVCKFYEEYGDLIEYYCTKSKHSLRYPYRKTTKFYGKTQQSSKVTDGVEGEHEDRIVSSSYFKYKTYPFLYRFFESYEYHRLEKKFHSMLQVDVSKCFPSIYTHSIGWAVKNKRLAKAKTKGSFDSEFDNLMQLTNYRETNGILIGPEVSRIFSEVILQRIDLNLIDKMHEQGYTVSKDYDFRRYVDDYFIFYRSEEVKQVIEKKLEICLLDYKMYLNEAKKTIASRPFATEISLTKHSLRKTVSEFYSSRYNNLAESDDNSIVMLHRPDAKANRTISEIKMALANYKIEYSSISNYLFSAITKKIHSYIAKLSNIDTLEEHHINWLLVDLDVLFFVHAMDIRIRPTDRLARLISELTDHVSNWSKPHFDTINKKIFDHVKQAINIYIDHSNDIIGLETLNLLMILTMLPDEYQLPANKLEEYINSLSVNSETNDFYFRWVTFMLYVGSKAQYQEIHDKLINLAEDYLLNHEDMFISTEYFIFYFDYLACPYIDESRRQSIMDKVKKITFDTKKKPVSFKLIHHGKIVLKNDFVVAWRDPDYLKATLEKKEYIFSYN